MYSKLKKNPQTSTISKESYYPPNLTTTLCFALVRVAKRNEILFRPNKIFVYSLLTQKEPPKCFLVTNVI